MEGEVQVRRWDKGAGHNIKEKGSRSEAFYWKRRSQSSKN